MKKEELFVKLNFEEKDDYNEGDNYYDVYKMERG